MKTCVKILWTAVLTLTFFGLGILLSDKHCLGNEILRLHVVAASDSEQDQSYKLSVRDAVTAYLQENMVDTVNIDDAKECIVRQIPALEEIANKTLRTVGSKDSAKVYLTKESFGKREYDTFSLPSGVYETLRIDIGGAEGKNWWCVVFPSLCLPDSVDAFQDTAVECGMEQGLVNTLSGQEGYEVRFFFLDCLGKIENFFNLG